ncbi:MAG: DoxX family protein [Candidatus Hydrogenedentes bacterium]|nr:DoxX family protein [Candidatus Hydrogenedentota bacterium]
MAWLKTGLMILMAIMYVALGINHFRNPDFYLNIMPLYIPNPLFWVQFTGVTEILGGAGLLIPATRRLAAWGIVLMLVGFFLVHVDMIIHAEDRFANIPYALLWVRIPLQFLLIVWACRYMIPPKTDTSTQHIAST